MTQFFSQLRSGKVLVTDGAMGTEILRLQTTPFDCCERANLQNRSLVEAIHHAYLDAGAEVLVTNTFQANPRALAKHGLGDQFSEIWQDSLAMAKSCEGRPHNVLADIGPIDGLTRDVAKALLTEARSADGVLLETWTSHDDLATFAEVWTESTLPMLVSFTYQCDAQGRVTTFANRTPEECARIAAKHGAVAIGANCGKEIGVPEMIEIVRRYHDVGDLPIFVRLNAGTPRDGIYPRSPEALAEELPRLLQEGIAMVGGCCGTTPDHIRCMRAAVERNGMLPLHDR